MVFAPIDYVLPRADPNCESKAAVKTAVSAGISTFGLAATFRSHRPLGKVVSEVDPCGRAAWSFSVASVLIARQTTTPV